MRVNGRVAVISFSVLACQLKIPTLDAGGPFHLVNNTVVLQTSDQYDYLKKTIILAKG